MSDVILSIVLPSYQEEENLSNLLPRIRSALDSINVEAEIIVVDTENEMDNTQGLCRKYDCRYVARHGGNNYGDAVRTGIDESNGEFILFMDADGSHSPEFIQNLFKYINSYDIVIASRYVSNGSTENSLILTLMSKILNITYSFVLGLPCKDVSNSYKIYHKNQLKSINLTCNNFDIVEEIIFKLYRSKKIFKIKEVPYA
ncbi:glycosyltransferase, partial [Candidatus Woesearchaeota archaeon]|nr:glycosyltransferase [Candidatus Woesearchaeota archaeon]MBT4764991.1 glycosyltransferase [bacterium]MBT7557309.1 glycosyltransferase [Candidatus Woesearchaeota archaeon]